MAARRRNPWPFSRPKPVVVPSRHRLSPSAARARVEAAARTWERANDAVNRTDARVKRMKTAKGRATAMTALKTAERRRVKAEERYNRLHREYREDYGR